MDTDPTLLGLVEDVSGSRVSVKLSDATARGMIFICGEGYRVGQVGSFVRIPAGYVDLFGVVVQVGAGAAPGPPELAAQLGTRWLRVELIGEGRRGGRFDRGISQYPSIGDPVHVVTESNLRSVYAPVDAESHVSIGRVASSEGIRAFIDLNRLVSRHSAVVGSTGSGKSTAVASLLSAISNKDKFPAARVILLDLHGEYAQAFGDRAAVYRVGADSTKGEQELYVPFWALSYDELMSIAMGSFGGPAQAFVQSHVLSAKQESKPGGRVHAVNHAELSVDTPLPFCIHQMWLDLYNLQYSTHTAKPSETQNESTRAYEVDKAGKPVEVGDALEVRRARYKGTKNEGGNDDKIYKSASSELMRHATETLEGRLKDPRLSFLFRPGKWSVAKDGSTRSDLNDLLAEWLCASKPVTVFDFSAIPKGVLDDLVGAVLRILYDAIFWGRRKPEGGRDRPLLIVLEEAHTYLGSTSKGRAASVARQISKEGRKYGVGLMLVSQRPSEIDATILSQCGTTIALRLTNEADRGHVRSCSADSLEGLFAVLPILKTGEALIVGEAVKIPVRAIIDLPPAGRRPDSNDPVVVAQAGPSAKDNAGVGWNRPLKPEDYMSIVQAWRSQSP